MSSSLTRRIGVAGLAGAATLGAGLLVAGPAGASADAKPAPRIPAAAQAAPQIAGHSAVTNSHVGAPQFRGTSAQVRALASQDGRCQVGDVCLYYLDSAGGFGSLYDTAHNDGNLFNNHFISGGSGQGAVVGSNAEYVWNRDRRTTVYLCTGLNSSGSCGFVGPNVSGDLTSTYRNLTQSITWGDSVN